MEKRTFTITVDIDILEAFKAKVPDRQRSATLTEFMRNYVKQETINKEEVLLMDEIEKLIKERENIAESLNILSTQLTIIRTNNATQKKEETTIKEQIYDSMMANNPLDR